MTQPNKRGPKPKPADEVRSIRVYTSHSPITIKKIGGKEAAQTIAAAAIEKAAKSKKP